MEILMFAGSLVTAAAGVWMYGKTCRGRPLRRTIYPEHFWRKLSEPR